MVALLFDAADKLVLFYYDLSTVRLQCNKYDMYDCMLTKYYVYYHDLTVMVIFVHAVGTLLSSDLL